MKQPDILSRNIIFLWIAAGSAVLLLIPLVAMQVTTEVNWQFTDFIVMGLLLFGTGSLFVVTARLIPNRYRLWAGLGCLMLFLFIWAELAVGVFTNWGS